MTLRRFDLAYRLVATPHELADLQVRIREAATWWSISQQETSPERALRSSELRPYGLPIDEHCWVEEKVVSGSIEHLAAKRHSLLKQLGVKLVGLEEALRTSRILGHDLPHCTYDELPRTLSPFFDRQDNPGWDAWLHCLRAVVGKKKSETIIVLSRIPEKLIEIADAAMESSTDCLFWLPSDLVSAPPQE